MPETNTLIASSTNYAIYSSALAQSYFAGNVGIGTSSPLAALALQRNYGSSAANIFTISSSTASTGNTSSTFLSVSSTGFGTTTLSGLNVSGSATSTSNVGFNIASGCYAVNGVCLSSGGSSASSSLLADFNTWTGSNIFNGKLTFVNATSSRFGTNFINYATGTDFTISTPDLPGAGASAANGLSISGGNRTGGSGNGGSVNINGGTSNAGI